MTGLEANADCGAAEIGPTSVAPWRYAVKVGSEDTCLVGVASESESMPRCAGLREAMTGSRKIQADLVKKVQIKVSHWRLLKLLLNCYQIPMSMAMILHYALESIR